MARFRIMTDDSDFRNPKNGVSGILSFQETFTKIFGHNPESNWKIDTTSCSHKKYKQSTFLARKDLKTCYDAEKTARFEKTNKVMRFTVKIFILFLLSSYFGPIPHYDSVLYTGKPKKWGFQIS